MRHHSHQLMENQSSDRLSFGLWIENIQDKQMNCFTNYMYSYTLKINHETIISSVH